VRALHTVQLHAFGGAGKHQNERVTGVMRHCDGGFSAQGSMITYVGSGEGWMSVQESPDMVW
jgi:hypothetical protein